MPPKPLSKGEEAFFLHCRAERLTPEREYHFHPERKWRFDFAFPEEKIAIEIEGGIFSGGAHTRGGKFIKDCEKYAEALILGWRVLRVTTDMATKGEAINYVLRLLGREYNEGIGADNTGL